MLQQLLLRGLNPSIAEGDVRQALSSFGNVVSVKMHQNGSTATVRMGDTEARAAAGAGSLNINGATLTVEIDSRFNSNGAPQGGRGGYQQGGPGGYGRGGGFHQQGGYPQQPPYGQNGFGYPQQGFGGYPQQPQGARVQIRVENCLYPVTTAVLSQALAMVSPALHVEAYPAANQTVQGSADFPDFATADNVVRTLNGKSIYPDCCRVLLNHMAPPPQLYGGGPMGGPMMGGRGMGYPPQMGMGMDGRGGRGRGRGGVPGAMGAPGAPGAMGAPGFTPYENAQGYQDPVVIVSGVPEDQPLKNLWTLMEVYGNVRTLRRQYSARTSVIATMYSHNDLRAMLQNINNCPFFGSTLTIKSFAGFNVKGGHQTEWNVGLATDPNTLAYDFSTSHHRGRPSDKAAPVRKGRPAKYLFVTNLSDKITDDMCKALFTSKGFTLLDFERKSDTIAIIDFESVDIAIRALCEVHATLMEERHIKVSFSLWPPHSVPPGVNAEKADGEDDTAQPAADAAAAAPAAPADAAPPAAEAVAAEAAAAPAEQTEEAVMA